jgi:hypothetical protein
LDWPWKNSKGRYASGAEFERVAGVGSSGIGREPMGKFHRPLVRLLDKSATQLTHQICCRCNSTILIERTLASLLARADKLVE